MGRRKRRKRRGFPWVAAAAVLVLALGIWLLLETTVFVVRSVEIVGSGDVPEAEVRHLANIKLGSRMNSLDEPQIHLDVEGDGRVAFVSLEKRLPSRVVLTVRPRTKDVVALQGGGFVVLDSDGYVVDITKNLPGGQAVYVTGLRTDHCTLGRQLSAADGRCAAMKAVVEALKEQGATRYVSELSVEDTRDLRVLSRTGISVLLGDAGNMREKVTWMVGALSDLESRGETTGRLDISSGTKADFTPPEATPTPVPTPTPTPQPTATEEAGS